MTNQAAQTMPSVPQAFFDEFGVNADDRVMDYGRACYEAGLNAGRHPDALPDGTLSKSTAKRVTALTAASVSDRARYSMKLLRFGRGNGATPWILEPHIDGYWTPWHTAQSELDMAVESSNQFERALEQALTQQRGEVEDEDYHVIMSMGRLLAEIAVILKGAEPAGTAWSYHDLPELVKSAVENAHDIASEMRAWAAVKMRERGSSRRDKMMVEEWSKRLLALPEVAFPVKDFDIPGLSITKEEIRFAIRKVVADRVFIGQDFGGTTPQPSADAVRELVKRAYEVVHHDDECPAIGGNGDKDCRCDAVPFLRELESLLSAASGEKGVGK